MKNYIITAIILIGAIPAIAQQHDPPQAGDNFLNPALDKFVGTWIWTSGKDTVKIFLKKENSLLPYYNYRKDRIVGFHLYKKDSIIMESSIQFQQTSHSDGKSTILMGTDPNNSSILIGSFRDLGFSKLVDLKLTLNGIQNKLTLFLREIPGLRYGDTSNYGKFSIPNNIVLKRPIEELPVD